MSTELQRQIARVEAMGKTWTISKAGNYKAYNKGNKTELGLKRILEGLELYLEGFKQKYEMPIGEDYALAPYFESILKSLKLALSGEIGHFDGGTLENTLAALAENNCLKIY